MTKVRTVSRRVAHRRLVPNEKATKSAVAQAIVARFPELASRCPPERKLWMSEDDRQAIFDATVFGLTVLRGRDGVLPAAEVERIQLP